MAMLTNLPEKNSWKKENGKKKQADVIACNVSTGSETQ